MIGLITVDGKQQNLLPGDISNSGICGCPSCKCQRGNFGRWSPRLLRQYRKRFGAEAAAAKSSYEPQLRVGCHRVEQSSKIFEKETHGKQIKLTAKKWRWLPVQCRNDTAKPALRIPVQKISCDPLHISAGVINHLLDAICAAIRAQLDADSKFLRAAQQAIKELEQMLRR